MIIPNGQIQFKIKGKASINESTGYPVRTTSNWSEPVPCQFYPVRQNLQDVINGEPRATASYVVLLEITKTLPSYLVLESMKITDDRGNEIGEYVAISIEELRAVNQIRIII